MKPLLAVMTGQKHAERRAACLQTWLDSPGMDWVFFVGSHRAGREGHLLHLPCPDTWNHLPRKTHAMIRWALAQGYDRLFKADDDSYVHTPRLLAEARRLGDDFGYIGRGVTNAVNPRYAGLTYAQGGAGYWLDRRCMELLAAEPEPVEDDLEDGWVAQVLLRHGIPLREDHRYCPTLADGEPRRANTIITTHHITPQQMRGPPGDRRDG